MHNLVAVCRNSGMSAQAAFDALGKMLQCRFRDCYLALASLPSWGTEIDAQVQNYIRGVLNVVRANLNWRYATMSKASLASVCLVRDANKKV